MPYFVYPTPLAKQHRRIWVKKSHESTKMCDTAKLEHSTAKPCPYFWGIVYIITHERAKHDKICWVIWMLSDNLPVTNVSWRLAEGYPLTLSANVLRTFRKLSILTFWERYLLTLSRLSANVLLTLFCWVGKRYAFTVNSHKAIHSSHRKIGALQINLFLLHRTVLVR